MFCCLIHVGKKQFTRGFEKKQNQNQNQKTAAKLSYFKIHVYFCPKIILIEICFVKELIIISLISVFIITWTF